MNENIIYDYFPTKNSGKYFRQISFGLVGPLFKLLSLRHNINVLNGQKLINNVVGRPEKKPLLTLVNHASICDDTFIYGNTLPLKILINPNKMRWTLTAVDVCFTNSLIANLFFFGQCIPVWRNVRCRESGDLLQSGLGVHQPSMNFAVEILNSGGWLNLFPQGRIIYDYEKMKEESYRLRWGVGRIYCESVEKPIILPLWHCGLEQVCPVVKPYFWHALKSNVKRKNVTIMVGDEIKIPEMYANLPNCQSTWARITEYVQEKFFNLRQKSIAAHKQFLIDKE